MKIQDLPPWTQQEYMALPVETNVSVVPAGVVACVGDPNRRLIMFGLQPGATGSVQASTVMNANAAQGFVLNTTTLILTISLETHGALVTVPWFLTVTAAGSAMVTVLTQSILRWPGANGYVSPIEEVDRNATNSLRNGSALRRSANYADANSGSESTQEEIDSLAAALQSLQCKPSYQHDGERWLPPSSWRWPLYRRR